MNFVKNYRKVGKKGGKRFSELLKQEKRIREV